MKLLLLFWLSLVWLGASAQSGTGTVASRTQYGVTKLGAGLVTVSGVTSVSLNDAGGTLPDANLSAVMQAKSATILASTYANAVSQCAALATGVAALVKVAADESPGNAGTGTGGANPTTYYLYFPVIGLIQQVTYPN